jgi:hypothetical protein
MLQRVVQHEPGRFTACPRCGLEPRHVIARGRGINEPVQFAPSGERHAVQCTTRDCGHSTGLHTSLADAEAEWRSFPQLSLRLPARQSRQAAA